MNTPSTPGAGRGGGRDLKAPSGDGTTDHTTTRQAGNIQALAADIRREHEAAHGKAREALEHARRAGELLIQAKAQVPHGAWLPWLAEHCQFSERTAQRYVQLAAGWPALQAKYDATSDLTLSGALAVLSHSDDGARLVRRLETLAEDLGDEGADDAKLTVRMATLRDDAAEVIAATDDAGALARIIDAARSVEQAAAARRVSAMRALGVAIRDVEAPAMSIPDLDDEDMAVASFEIGNKNAIIAIARSHVHPGFFDYGVIENLDSDGALQSRSRRPVRCDALELVLAYQQVPCGVEWKVCRRDDSLLGSPP